MHTFFPALLLACACLPMPLPAWAHCALADEAPAMLDQWKTSGFATVDTENRNRRAFELLDCLGDPDPLLRDGTAFEALSTWMRGKQLDPDTLRLLQQRLLQQLKGADVDGFRKPFTALVLSEVARTDRVQPWMTADERRQMTAAATEYLTSVRDYRGYVDGEGWRHGVAHGADWILQLALNKALSPSQVLSLLAAIGSQAMPADGHAYAFGEPGRLARPVAYAIARGDLEQPTVDAWLAGLAQSLGPRPETAPQAVWWVRRANLENFLHALAYLADGDQSPALTALAAGARATMQELP
ncbi:DUF2785 domain-containing protein [Thermomonas sp. HDW16]|uniref:DUF2785 domain-containing protein n=1 Tax=Thermomonas sp. HDW16 TaxID=2714945 RepID=UPI001408CD87|nr:DUF2785 domain-containing protein [Thermomonas sp. HDW16]QIL19851.1 DUF2785 domain-containing protein [Thermomonas sp. HDW16]